MLHTERGALLVSAATMTGENAISVSVSGGHGVLLMCESSIAGSGIVQRFKVRW